MNTIWGRANAIFFAAIFSLGIMCTLTTLSTYIHSPQPEINKLGLNTMYALNYSPKEKLDKAFLTFDLAADLSTVFNWNVKQIFVFLVAEYKTKKNKLNQVVVWDKIISSGKKAKRISSMNQNIKYILADQYDELRNSQVTLKLMWDIMPVCGRMFIHENGSTSFSMPTVYTRG